MSARQHLRSRRNVEVTVDLPILHDDQVSAFNTFLGEQYTILRCGRRYGKSKYGETWAMDGLIHGEKVGWFAPVYKLMSEVYRDMLTMTKPIRIEANKTDGIIRTLGGGQIEFWTLENEDAGRSRGYHRIVIDEAAFTNNATMMNQWEKAIHPTLADYNGRCLVCSNTNGVDPENFLYKISPAGGDAPGKDGRGGKHRFREYHAPSFKNPHLSKSFLDLQKANSHPLVWKQEYLAEFVDWSGVAFFAQDKWLVNGQPVPAPRQCDAVFAIVDSAAKTGKENDGTAVVYYAVDRAGPHKLMVLDWDITQIEGALLDTWLQVVFQNLEAFAKATGARHGSLGAHIEDKSTGIVLLQQAKRRGWNAHQISTQLTALGKDERAISVSGYHYRGLCKMTEGAFNKVSDYKGTSRNHMLGQVVGFRIGDKDAAKRADDLLDCYTYGLSIALGDSKGF